MIVSKVASKGFVFNFVRRCLIGKFLASCQAQIAKGDSWNATKTADEALAMAKAASDKKEVAGATHLLAKAQAKEKKLDDAAPPKPKQEGLHVAEI